MVCIEAGISGHYAGYDDADTTYHTAILFLCSKEARWITGLIMPVDAGVSWNNSFCSTLND